MKSNCYVLICCFFLALSAGCAQTQYVHVGPNWDAVNNLQASDDSFRVLAEGPIVAWVGEDLSFTVKSEQSGRLWVVRVDPNDEMAMLFPNELSGTNWIDGGRQISLPAENANYAITADNPKGVSTVAFIVTDPDTDLSAVLSGQRASMVKALHLVQATPSWGIAHIVVDVQ